MPATMPRPSSIARFLSALILLPTLAHAQPAAKPDNPDNPDKPDNPGPAYKSAPGPHQVATTDLTLHDAGRAKDLPIKVLAPKPTADQPGPFPLIVFSHGLGGSNDAFPDLTQHWASYGYVVILPTHADSIKLRRTSGEDLSRLRNNLKLLEKDADLPGRAADITFILDSLDTIEPQLRPSPEPNPTNGGAGVPPALPRNENGGPSAPPALIDRTRIGLAGHSAGAFTTQLVFGVKIRNLPGAPSLTDDRIKAAILVSGQGLNRRIFTKESWANLTKPMMVITGSRDTAAIGNETPESRQDPFTYAHPGDKYLIFIEGATHSSYSGQAAAMRLDPDEPDPATLKMIGAVTASGTLAFWDAHLRGEDPARTYLAGDDLQKLSDGKAALKRK